MNGKPDPSFAPAQAASSRPVLLVRVHGGSGMSTVARLLDPDQLSLVSEGQPGQPIPPGLAPVLVARSNAMGTGAAAALLQSWRGRGLPRPGLLVVADVPLPDPPVVRYRLKALSSLVVGVVRFPFLMPLRAADDPAVALQHRAVRDARDQLMRQLQELSALSAAAPAA